MTNETMVEFRLPGVMPLKYGEVCLMRVSMMMCLFPEHRQIRTIESGWTIEVCENDWDKVERAFRSAFLGRPMKMQESDY